MIGGVDTKRTKWRDLSKPQRIAVAVLSIVQFALLGAALWDLRKRPQEQIRGNKRLWMALAFVNWIGPLAYFKFGRRG
jgi:ABC-type uncharacterized transport system permease subunit